MGIDAMIDIEDRVVNLRVLCSLFAETLREIDIPGRLGREEFGVLLKAVEVAERLRAVIANTKIPLESGLQLQFTVCIGIVTLTDNDTNIGILLNIADNAIYQAKQTGRNKVCFQRH